MSKQFTWDFMCRARRKLGGYVHGIVFIFCLLIIRFIVFVPTVVTDCNKRLTYSSWAAKQYLSRISLTINPVLIGITAVYLHF